MREGDDEEGERRDNRLTLAAVFIVFVREAGAGADAAADPSDGRDGDC